VFTPDFEFFAQVVNLVIEACLDLSSVSCQTNDAPAAVEPDEKLDDRTREVEVTPPSSATRVSSCAAAAAVAVTSSVMSRSRM